MPVYSRAERVSKSGKRLKDPVAVVLKSLAVCATRFRATVTSLILGLFQVQNSPRRSSRRWIRCTWWFGTLSCPLRSAGLFCQAAANVWWSFVICRHVLACRTHSCRYHRREVSACQTWSHPPLQRDLYRIHTSPAPLQGAPLITTNSIYNYSKTLITQPTPLSRFNTWINVQIRIRSKHQRDEMSWTIGQNKDGCHIFSFCLWTKWNQNFPRRGAVVLSSHPHTRLSNQEQGSALSYDVPAPSMINNWLKPKWWNKEHLNKQ